MSPIGHAGARSLACLLLLASASGCKRSAKPDEESTPAVPSTQTSSPAIAESAPIAFEDIDPRALPARGVPAGTEGRFNLRPAIVASPCGFHLVISQSDQSWTALLVGRELSWSEESAPPLLRLDGITLDVGLIDASAMGGVAPLAQDRLLELAGQWESTWLRREVTTEGIPIKENARGQAHLEPHPAWRVWSATLGPSQASAGVPTSHVIVATVALGERVLVLRALLAGEELALRALRRLVFAVDSIEHRSGALGKLEFTTTLQQAARADPTCSSVHDAHDAHLQ
jgi:hypothetical protein